MNKSEHIYKGVVLNLYKETVTLPNGNTVVLDVARHPGAAAAVPILDDGSIVMIRQFRYAAGGYLYEIPAGKLDVKGEQPLECAKRELLEEAGYTAAKWTKLVSLVTSPGFCDEVIHIYMAQDLTKGKTEHEKDEVIEIEIKSRKEIEAMMDKGEITDSKTLAGLYSAFRKLEK